MNNLMGITEEQATKIKSTYEDNRRDLEKLNNLIEKEGFLECGCTHIEDTFEQGFNNGIEFVCNILGIVWLNRRRKVKWQ